jgi:hypothetical protein
MTFLLSPMLWAQLPDPLGHWTFDEGSGNITADVSGNGDDGMIWTTGVSWSTDTPTGKGYSLEFSGTGAVHIGDPDILKVIGDITLAAWIKTGPATQSWNNIVVKGHNTGENVLRVDGNTSSHTGTQIWCGSYDNTDHMVKSYELSEGDFNTWIHAVGTYSTTYQLWSLYLNGIMVNTSPDAVGAVTVDRGWAIGARASADGTYPTERHFTGLIDDVRIYNVALTEDEVSQLYSQTLNAVNDRSHTVPTDFTMSQNYPNPFNPQTHFDYQVPHEAQVNISVYNILGQLVTTLVDGVKSPGYYSVNWNATDRNGSQVSGGIYIAKMVSNDYSVTRKLILLK